MKVIVLGVAGLTGRHVERELRRAGHEVEGWQRVFVDVRASARLTAEVVRARPQAIVNCAAMADMDAAEGDPELAFDTNERGAANVARAAFVAGAKLVHLSTNFVYRDYCREPGYEDSWSTSESQPDIPPCGAYARSKWAGDDEVLRRHPANVVLRTQSIYGVGGGNYVSKVAEKIQRGEACRLDPTRKVAPTSATALARAVVALLSAQCSTVRGVVHFQCDNSTTTWHRWGTYLRELLGCFSEVHSYDPPYRAPRPYVMLACEKLRAVDVPIPTWESALAEYALEVRR